MMEHQLPFPPTPNSPHHWPDGPHFSNPKRQTLNAAQLRRQALTPEQERRFKEIEERQQARADRAEHRNFEVARASESETTFRHGGWKNLRARVRQGMVDAHFPASRLERFDNCGAAAWLYVQEKDGTPIIRSSHCHDRYCLPCAAARAHRIAQALVPQIEKSKTVHVVLTLKSSNLPLADQVKHLYASFTRLRRSKFWKSRCPGGYYCLEVTRNEKTGLWHPHLHCLTHSQWLPQRELSYRWEKATGGSSVVHVSLVQKHEAAVREVTKYVTKPLHGSVTQNPEVLAELMRSLNGTRLTSTYGTWRTIELLPEPTAEEREGWKPICSLHELLQKAAAKDTWALATLSALQARNVRNDAAPQLPLFSSA